MLSALLFVCLTVLTSASVLDFKTFEARNTNVSLDEFFQFLQAPETLMFRDCIIEIICRCDFGTEYLAAFLSAAGNLEDVREELIEAAGAYYRLDFVSFFGRKGI